MSEMYDDSSNEIDVTKVPNFGDDMTLSDVIGHFESELVGKTLMMHFLAGDEEDIVTDFPIYAINVGEDGVVGILTQDELNQPAAHQFNGDSEFIWSVYEAGDIWFQDSRDERIWYGIYDEPLELIGYIKPIEE